jgi:hypothetical protein
MKEMFDTNNIPVEMEQLVHLFFKGKGIPKNEKDYYLDFFQFMEFALSKEADQAFREFMRNVKETVLSQKKEQLFDIKEESHEKE